MYKKLSNADKIIKKQLYPSFHGNIDKSLENVRS